MKKPIWEEQYQVNSYLVNLRGRLGLYSLLNLIQDVGWQHARNLEIQLDSKFGWVFTRQKVLMSEWPKWNDEISIRTWVRTPHPRGFLLRDYEIFLKGRKIGEATSTFAVMDMGTRKMAIMDWKHFDSFWVDAEALSHNPEKVPAFENGEVLAQFQVRNSDMDLNNHVNNTKYAQWILDALPISILKGPVDLLEYEVNFLAETKLGDEVSVYKSADEVEGDLTKIRFQGAKIGSENKPVFTASMKIRS